MPNDQANIILIGMPGSGKSTIGVILAKRSARDFVDTDLLIQSAAQRSLQDILDQDGYLALREIEAQVLLGLDVDKHVISTGGSAVYSDAAMRHLKRKGICVYLEVSLGTLRARITDYETRGIAKRPDQSFDDLFDERARLYRQYADITVNGDGKNQEEVCQLIMEQLDRWQAPATCD
jgi:shikimate kinase